MGYPILDDFKREHPHLKLIIAGDGLFSNGPYILEAFDFSVFHLALFAQVNSKKCNQ